MQPVTASIKHQFRCHIRHAAPSVLYRLFYYVQVPSASSTSSVHRPRFQTTKLHRTVASRPGDLAYSQRGRYDVDFLTAVHDTGLQLLDDFVLTAVRAAADDDDDEERWNYSVRASTVRTPAASGTVPVHTVSENVFITAVQPQRPFSYRFERISNQIKSNQITC